MAIAVRVSMGIALGAFHVPPAGEMVNVARSVVTQGVFGNPNGLPSGPTAHVAPAYPYLIAVLLKLTPSAIAFSSLITAVGIVAASLLWGLLPLVAERLGLPRRVGMLGALLGAANPLRRWVELIGYWDTALSGLCVMAMVAVTFSRRSRWTRPSQSLTIGLGWGLLCLLQPAGVTVFAVLCGVLLLAPVERPGKILGIGIVLLAFCVTLTPWTIRNYRTFGGLMFIRSNLGVELSVSNNDGAIPSRENVQRNPQARHPHISPVEFERRNEVGELRYGQDRRAEALAWMAAHPARFAYLTIRRVQLFWFPERSYLALSALEWILTALAAVGLLSLIQRREPAGWLILGIWVLYPLIYYVLLVDERYRYPIEWSIVLAAAAGIFHVAGQMRIVFGRPRDVVAGYRV